jgi:hypothetical protein
VATWDRLIVGTLETLQAGAALAVGVTFTNAPLQVGCILVVCPEQLDRCICIYSDNQQHNRQHASHNGVNTCTVGVNVQTKT